MKESEYTTLRDSLVLGGALIEGTFPDRPDWLYEIFWRYAQKIQRLIYLIDLPICASLRTMLTCSWHYESMLEVMQIKKCSRDELFKPPLSELVAAAAERKGKFYASQPIVAQLRIARENGIQFLTQQENSKDIDSGLMSIFIYVIIQSYASFETLAGELWIALLNNGSMELRKKVFDSIKPDKKKSLVDNLKENHFNLSDCLGTVLKQSECVGFQSIKKIREAFDLIDAEFSRVTFGANEFIWVASSFRNILIHNDGKADQQFKDSLGPFAEFRNLPLNEKVELTGDLVSRIRTACSKASAEVYFLSTKIALAS